MTFEGKVVLITGASSGIGADAARYLAELGASVSMVGRNEKRLNDVAEEIIKAGSPKPLTIIADVTMDCDRIVDETIKHFSRLDVLVNNAGISFRDRTCEIVMSEFDRLFDINVRSVIKLTQLCVPHLEKTKGCIVNVSSVSGLRPTPSLTSYGISKAALDQFTKYAAIDLAKKRIRVNGINPAAIKTPIFDNEAANEIDGIFEKLKNSNPVGRVGDVSDTSKVIAFLSDNELSSFINGICLPVCGGSIVAGVYTYTE